MNKFICFTFFFFAVGTLSSTIDFNIMQMNLFDDPNPVQISGESERLPQVTNGLKYSLPKNGEELDVITFDEAWSDTKDRVKTLRSNLKTIGFQYQTGGESG